MAQFIKLSSSEIRFFFQEQFYLKQNLFNEYGGVFINGKLDKEILNKSLQINVLQHLLLKAHVIINEEIPYFKITDDFNFDIQYIEVKKDVPNRSAFVENLQNIIKKYKIIEPSFNIFRSPLFKVYNLLFEKTSAIIITMHHIISDGYYSNKFFFNNLNIIYSKLYLKQSCKTIKETTTGYFNSQLLDKYLPTTDKLNFVANRRQIENIEKYLYPRGYAEEDLKKFWKDYLEGSEKIKTIDTNTKNKHVTNYLHKKLELKNLTHRIKLLGDTKIIHKNSDNNHDSLNKAFFIACIAAGFFEINKTDTVILGIPFYNRFFENIFRKSIGYYGNVLPLKIDFNKKNDILYYMLSISNDLMKFREFATPFQNIVKWVKPNWHKNSNQPFFNFIVSINHKEELIYFDRNDEIYAENIYIPAYKSLYDLNLDIKYNDFGCEMNLEYKNFLENSVPSQNFLNNLSGTIINILELDNVKSF